MTLSARVAFPTALVGLGRIAAGLAHDQVMARHYPYASHAQALSDHPAFDWIAAVEPDPAARTKEAEHWNLAEISPTVEQLNCRNDISVAIVATPPEVRLEVVSAFPNLRAVLIEKPLAADLEEAQALVDFCATHNILLAVNLTRRADTTARALSDGGLRAHIGSPQAGFGIYGDGANNNATHLVDLVHMLLGPTTSVMTVGAGTTGDPAFVLTTEAGVRITVEPIDFRGFREVSLDLWGDAGRLEFLHEGLTLRTTTRAPHRFAEQERELAHDEARISQSGVGTALYDLYENLSDALTDAAALYCTGDDALRVSAVIAAVQQSAKTGSPVPLPPIGAAPA